MRIIAGTFRSRKLEFPLDESIRPTRDMVREAIFSALGNCLNTNILDLFSGTGAYGLEAISRGASSSTFVDNSDLANKFIKININSLGVNEKVKVLNMDFLAALSYLKDKEKFDIVFVDPPYKMDIYQEVVDTLINNNLITKSSIVVLEWNKPIEIKTNFFNKAKQYKYKDNHILILKNL